MSKKVMQWVIILIALIAIVLILFFMLRKPAQQLPAPVQINTTNQPTLGNANAPIHVVAFEDLKCANCMRFDTRIFPKLKKDYIDTGRAKYTLINLAFIPGSEPAAQAARCVYDQSTPLFFNFVDYVYHHQPPETANWATIPHLMSMASNVKGINTQQLMQCLAANKHQHIAAQNMKVAEKIMPDGVATPSVYVNGVAVIPLTWNQLNYVISTFK